MRIAILQAAAIDESLAICDLAGALLARGHRVRLLLEQHEPSFRDAIVRFRPDVAVVQCAFMGEPWTRRVLAGLPRDLPAVLVGTAITFDPSVLLRVGAAHGLRGELDVAGPAFVERIAVGGDPSQVPGYAGLRGGEPFSTELAESPDLSTLPLPDRDVYFQPYPWMGRFPWKRFATGRGCVHSCGFCYLPPLRQLVGGVRPYVRRKSVDRVIAEVCAVRVRWPVRAIHFADDLFAPSRPWLEELALRWPREVGIRFTCNTSPETVTEANAALLARAGARVVGIGLETANEVHRNDTLGRPTRSEAIRAAASRLQAHGIEVLTFNMIANPGESLDDAIATLTMNQQLGTRYARVNLAYPAPNSKLADGARALGIEPPPPDAHSRAELRAWCADEDAPAFESLKRVFLLALRAGLSADRVRRIVRAAPASWLRPLRFYDAWLDVGWTGVSPFAAAEYALHAGPPTGRVTYHESLP